MSEICNLFLSSKIYFQYVKNILMFIKNYFENLKVTKEEPPQVLFLDLNMPVLTGWEFLDIFKTRFAEDFPNLKILVVSSSVDPTDLQLANKNPMVMSFLSKPIDKIKLNSLKFSPEFKQFFDEERA